MIRQLYSILALLALIHMAALAGVGGYIFTTSELDREKFEQIAAVIRGDVPQPQEADVASPQHTTDEPVAGESSESRIKASIDAQELEQLKTDRARVELQHQQILVDRRMLRLQKDIEAFETRVAGYESRLAEQRAQELSAQFAELVKTVAGMKPKNALAALMARPEPEAVRILLEMNTRKRNQIVDGCKTPEQIRWRDAMFDHMLLLSAQAAPEEQQEVAP